MLRVPATLTMQGRDRFVFEHTPPPVVYDEEMYVIEDGPGGEADEGDASGGLAAWSSRARGNALAPPPAAAARALPCVVMPLVSGVFGI